MLELPVDSPDPVAVQSVGELLVATNHAQDLDEVSLREQGAPDAPPAALRSTWSACTVSRWIAAPGVTSLAPTVLVRVATSDRQHHQWGR